MRIRTRYGGICSSDLAAILLEASPYLSALASFPYTFGHENTGTIEKTGTKVGNWLAGERVVVEPTLWCKPRGFVAPCEFCARGEINRCTRTNLGEISPGLMIGACRDTGGSWSSHFVAHSSQLCRLPDEVDDENALMVEPFAVGLHAALMAMRPEVERVLIIGAGCIGLCTLAALKALGSPAEVAILARHEFQRQAALKLGANRVMLTSEGEILPQMAEFYQAEILKPRIGKAGMMGGADLAFECAGKTTALQDAIRFTRNGGRVISVGIPGVLRNLDWSPVFIHELVIQSSYVYNHCESVAGEKRRTFDLAIELMKNKTVDLGWMVTNRFSLEQYKQAFYLLGNRRESGVIKAVFEFDNA